MNRNGIVGLSLVVFAVASACLLAGSAGAPAKDLLGKAVWYLPYVAFVGGVKTILRARG